MTEKIVNQGDKGVLLLGSGLKRELRALWHASQLDDVVPNCSIGGWQGGRLLWTPRIMSSLSWADCKVFQWNMFLQSCCKRWIQYSALDIQMKSVDLLLLLNSKLLILQLQLIPNIRVGEACYHTEEIGVDCDKTTHGHPCCLIR